MGCTPRQSGVPGDLSRARCLKAGAKDGALLKYSSDESLGNVCKIVPERNLFDVTKSGSDFLLDLLQHRATTSLFEQYSGNPNGDPGDLDFIEEMIGTGGLQHADYRDSCFTSSSKPRNWSGALLCCRYVYCVANGWHAVPAEVYGWREVLVDLAAFMRRLAIAALPINDLNPCFHFSLALAVGLKVAARSAVIKIREHTERV
ncbi:unnamed protein product [Clonostachys rhizophaga]|uniref:Uncharacterized protein n=1 Tax=Clonostachys rhizophaga TaxID=160324 RepID=A0A9N9YE37_9HYPO|nr:unnamed protein product [Clonostachys rhizophaga]